MNEAIRQEAYAHLTGSVPMSFEVRDCDDLVEVIRVLLQAVRRGGLLRITVEEVV